tara:strand:+ start:331 stop:741 length:411 start_codon:yes stop_codon:yes gene_type:complete
MKICIIVSNFYPEISNKLVEGAKATLKKNNITKFKLFKVPGTYEIPVLVSNLVDSFDAFIVLGCVIKGKTPHFDYICSSVFQSLSLITVKTKIPIGNGILTCYNKKQAFERADIKKGNKGGDAADAIVSVLKIIKQ